MSIRLLTLLRTAKMPKSFSPLDELLLNVHADAHQDNLGKAILPMRELIERFNYHPKSLERSRGRLVQVGALIRVTKGYEGQASEYAVSEEFLLAHQVTPRLRVSRNKRKSGYQDVAPELSRSNATDSDTLPDGYPILKDEQTNKRKDKELVSNFQLQPESAPTRINRERWTVITAQIPSNVKRLIDPGANYERLLDELVRQGWKLPAIADHVGRIKWDNAVKCGAILEHVLRELAGVARPRQDDSPSWCERDGCDPITRTWLEPSERSDGSVTHNCPQCHPREVGKTKENTSATEFDDFLKENFKNFGTIPE